MYYAGQDIEPETYESNPHTDDWRWKKWHKGQEFRKKKENQTSRTYSMVFRADKTIAWNDFAKTAQTGDIVIFAGGSMISKIIGEVAEGMSPWSHIAMLLKTKGKRLLLWESTSIDSQMDLVSKKRRGGVRLVDAETVIRHYLHTSDGAMVVARRLYIDASAVERDLINPVSRLPNLRTFIKEVWGLPYESNPLDMARAMVMGRWINLIYASRSESSFFCSELVACSYIVLGLLPNDMNPDNNTDIEFALGNDNNTLSQLKKQKNKGDKSWLDSLFNYNPKVGRPSLYTPMDFAQESEDLPFLQDEKTGKPLVGLGKHLQIVFPDVGRDPMAESPKYMEDPIRPNLTLQTDLLKEDFS